MGKPGSLYLVNGWAHPIVARYPRIPSPARGAIIS